VLRTALPRTSSLSSFAAWAFSRLTVATGRGVLLYTRVNNPLTRRRGVVRLRISGRLSTETTFFAFVHYLEDIFSSLGLGSTCCIFFSVLLYSTYAYYPASSHALLSWAGMFEQGWGVSLPSLYSFHSLQTTQRS